MSKSATVSPDGDRPLYLLHAYLQNGRNLAVKDASGSSDPYVKFFHKKKLIYRSHTVFKTVNPQWDEKFVHAIENINEPLRIEVYDYDRFSDDDFMGCATLDLSTLDDSPTQSKVSLMDKKGERNYPGYLLLTVSVTMAKGEEAQAIARNRLSSQTEVGANGNEGKGKRGTGVRKGSKMWTDLIRVVLVEGKNLMPLNNKTDGSPPDTYIKFKLGQEKYKSKTLYNSWNPRWLEQFSLRTRHDQSKILEVLVVDAKKDTAIGKFTVDLSGLKTHEMLKRWYALDNGISEIFLSILQTGKLASRVVAAADSETGIEDLRALDDPETKALMGSYGLYNTWRVQDIWNVGYLVVRVYRARNLAAADIGNSSDPFCVVELVNARLETHTDPKTLNPEWNTVFTFYVSDIHSVLEFSIFDEDRYTKADFIGKVSIPLLNIKNNEKTWYPLKNQDLSRRVKGEILVEMNLSWNPMRAALATVMPMEPKYDVKAEPFRRRVFVRNIERMNRFLVLAFDLYQYYQLCLSWESPQRSSIAFLFSMVMAYSLQPATFPLAILMLFLFVFLRKQSLADIPEEAVNEEASEQEDDDDTTDEKNWKTIRSYMQQRQVSLSFAQNMTDFAATHLEKAKNILEFKQPFVSWFAVLCLVSATIALIFIPFNWVAMALVVKKFTRRIRRPHAVHSNELLDFISRAPSDLDVRKYYGYK